LRHGLSRSISRPAIRHQRGRSARSPSPTTLARQGGEGLARVGLYDYPKLLCLDQNKWIDLARAHYQKPRGTPFVKALQAVRQAVANGKRVVPITGANLYEAAEPAQGIKARASSLDSWWSCPATTRS
jgi:hypothetical protein